MGRSVLGWVCLCALGVVPLIGCSETAGDGGPECQGPADCGDGNECSADLCTNGACEATAVVDGTACTDGACLDGVCARIGAFPCTEQGIIDAIAEGGGPHFFACDGPQTVVTEAQIEIYNDVVLDGENNLTVDGNDDHGVIAVAESITAELRGFTVTGGNALQVAGAAPSKAGWTYYDVTSGGIDNSGVLTLTNSRVVGNLGGAGGGILNTGSGSTLTLVNSTVSGNTSGTAGGGILNFDGTLTLTNSTVSGNSASLAAGGIFNDGGTATLTNSTVSGNSASHAGGIFNYGGTATLTLTDSTVSGNAADSSGIANEGEGALTLTNALVDDDCGGGITDVSGGGNIESPGNTCGFDQATDQVNVSADDLNLGPLADNGGPTMTHALLPGSVAIDVIPADMCDLDEDQRGEPRPGGAMCDVGAFERQPKD